MVVSTSNLVEIIIIGIRTVQHTTVSKEVSLLFQKLVNILISSCTIQNTNKTQKQYEDVLKHKRDNNTTLRLHIHTK